MRVGRVLGSAALACTGLLLVLVLAEAGTRWLDGYPLGRLGLTTWPVYATPPPPLALASLAARLGPDPETDPAWIDDPPPEIPGRPPVDPELLARSRLPRRPNATEDDLYHVWNSRWLKKSGCNPWGPARFLPNPLSVFDPPRQTIFPSFRHFPSRTTPLGLTTNRFGWRGPELALDKPPNTIRLAFVGASTTIGLHAMRVSYPEWAVHWFGRWAAHTGVDVRFEVINAGRGGLRSTAIAAVVKDEVLPLEPDLVVYYEGANQFVFTAPLTSVGNGRGWARPRPLPHRVLEPLLPYSALAHRALRLATWVTTRGGREAAKPTYQLAWPAGVDWETPDVDAKNLPLSLPMILRDLDDMRIATARTRALLVPSSFVWLVSDGLLLPGRRQQIIYHWLNEMTWPYTYADLRRLADFQNVVLRRWAAARGLPFLDVAAEYPQDPGLFLDAIHMNVDGTRLHGWLAFQGLLPLVRRQIHAGRLPRADRFPLASHPGFGPIRSYTLHCPPPSPADRSATPPAR
jgi:hypothetical protein